MVTVFLLAFLSAYCLGYFLTQPKKAIVSVGLSTAGWIIGASEVPLHIEVVPNGYPMVGQSWTIFVYEYSTSPGKFAFNSYPNSSVLAAVKLADHAQNYNLSVNDKGQATFVFQPEYQDVAFQAFSGASVSEKVVISEHYVSSNIVDQLSGGNLIALAVTVGGWFFSRNKIGKKSRFMVIAIICLFGLVTAISLFSKFFQETIWGYPERIIGQIITFTFLEDVTIAGFAIFVMFICYALFSIRKK